MCWRRETDRAGRQPGHNFQISHPPTAARIFEPAQASRLKFMDERRIRMFKRQRTARILIGLGCLILLVGSILHLIAGYPRVSAALATSNLSEDFKNALRAVFLMIGWTWIVIAIVTLMAAFSRSQTSKPMILFCGLALLLQIPIWVFLMGWFVGNEMFVLGAVLIVCGGLLAPGRRFV